MGKPLGMIEGSAFTSEEGRGNADGSPDGSAMGRELGSPEGRTQAAAPPSVAAAARAPLALAGGAAGDACWSVGVGVAPDSAGMAAGAAAVAAGRAVATAALVLAGGGATSCAGRLLSEVAGGERERASGGGQDGEGEALSRKHRARDYLGFAHPGCAAGFRGACRGPIVP